MTIELHRSSSAHGWVLVTRSAGEFRVKLGPESKEMLNDLRMTVTGLTVGESNRARLIEDFTTWVERNVHDHKE